MKSLLPVFLAALLPVPAFAADLCQDFIKDIRKRPDVMSGSAGVTENLREQPAFRAKEHSADSGGYDDTFSIPAAKTYAIVGANGAANCRGVNFYRTGKTKLKLPAPPIPDQRDLLEGNACEIGPASYEFFFGMFHGAPAFLFSRKYLEDFRETIWIAGLRDFVWDRGCRVDINFEHVFPAPHAFTAPDSGLKTEDWAKIASDIVQAHGPALENPNFRFGEALPEDQKDAATELLNTVREDGASDLPLFGRVDESAAAFFTNGNGGVSFHVVVLNNHPYVLQIGHRSGMRDFAFPEMGLILFDSRDGKRVPVASAFIGVKRGPLKSMKVAAR